MTLYIISCSFNMRIYSKKKRLCVCCKCIVVNCDQVGLRSWRRQGLKACFVKAQPGGLHWGFEFLLVIPGFFYQASWVLRFFIGFYARQHVMLSASLLRQRRPSVRLSVTLLCCVKTTQLRIMNSLPYDSLESLVSCEVIWCHWMKNFCWNILEIDQDILRMKLNWCCRASHER